jgi:putative NADH-flavin reductase
MTKLALFGATGKTGRHFLADALDEGYQVKALARDPASLTEETPSLTIVRGDAMNEADVREVIKGTDAVISLLGQDKQSDPWLQTQAIQHIIQAMQQEGVMRVISLTHFGVAASAEDEPGLLDKVMRYGMRLLIPKVYHDGIAHADYLQAANLRWTIVRAPILTDEPERGYYRIGSIGVNSGHQISRADLSAFLLTLLADEPYEQQMPVVSY